TDLTVGYTPAVNTNTIINIKFFFIITNSHLLSCYLKYIKGYTRSQVFIYLFSFIYSFIHNLNNSARLEAFSLTDLLNSSMSSLGALTIKDPSFVLFVLVIN